jgi:hypothetical protein
VAHGKLIASWPVVRQLDGDALGLGEAAESRATAKLAPRTRDG